LAKQSLSTWATANRSSFGFFFTVLRPVVSPTSVSKPLLFSFPRFRMHARAYVSQFNFRGNSQQKAIGMLSGGERNRVMLAKSMREGCNVLLLDEPTNDLVMLRLFS
jgi:ATPase subunit of ABC transporter with duplicated ATPase domains